MKLEAVLFEHWLYFFFLKFLTLPLLFGGVFEVDWQVESTCFNETV